MAQIKKAIVVVLAMAILFSLSVALFACGNDSELKWRFELNEDGKSYTALSDRKYDFDEEAYRKYVEKHRDDFQACGKKYAKLVEKASKNRNKVTKASIPAEHKGLPVTRINIDYFKNAFPNLTTITVSKNSEHFAAIDNVLYSKNIDAVYFVLKTLSGEFIIPNSVTSIGNEAFYGCTGLTSVTIPNSVTSIGSYAFSDCSKLTSVTIPDSVTSIGSYAFENCTSLTSIIIPDSITSIDETVFNGTAWYDNQPDGLLYVGKVVYKYIGTLPKNTSITLREDTLGITNYAFKNCSGLASITIPESVTSIGRDAFLGCSNLTSIYYTGDIESWCGISGLSTLMSESRTLYIDGNKVEGDLIIPDSVMCITNSAFAYCSGLTSVTIPNSTTSIGDSAFKACSSLTRISGSADNVRRIAWQANPNSFAIEITSGESIGDSAFKNCAGLRKVTISDSVTSVGYGAFEGCKDLTNISGSANNVSRIAQQANPNWFAIEITSGESIGDSAFKNCAGLRKVTISDSVTSIGRNAFGGTAWYNNKPHGLIYAGKVVYRYKGFMNGDTSITLREDTLGIASYAFYECSDLTSITIPNSVTNIGDFAFLRCPNLTNIYYTGDIASWCGISGLGWLMRMCESMTLYIDGNKLEGDLIIPDSVTRIGEEAFRYCDSLTSIEFDGTIEQWQAIQFGNDWDKGTGEYIVHCTDGTVAKDGTVTKS